MQSTSRHVVESIQRNYYKWGYPSSGFFSVKTVTNGRDSLRLNRTAADQGLHAAVSQAHQENYWAGVRLAEIQFNGPFLSGSICYGFHTVSCFPRHEWNPSLTLYMIRTSTGRRLLHSPSSLPSFFIVSEELALPCRSRSSLAATPLSFSTTMASPSRCALFCTFFLFAFFIFVIYSIHSLPP